MASDDARATQGKRVAAQSAADSAEPLRTRQVSGWATKPSVDTTLVADEDREPDDIGVGSESTRVTAEDLIERLREASRLEAAAQPLSEPESNQPYSAGSRAKETRDEDDTTIFVLHEEQNLRSSRLRRIIPLAAVAALTALMSIIALRATRAPAPVMPGKTATKVVSQAPRVRQAPSPTVIQLQPTAPLVEESVVSSAEEDVAEQAQQKLDTRRKWLRALERGNARLAAGKYDSAVFSFERAIEYHPQDSQAYAGLAEAHLVRGKWSEAARAFREAIALSPDDPSLREGLGRANAQTGRDIMVPQAYHQATALDSSISE